MCGGKKGLSQHIKIPSQTQSPHPFGQALVIDGRGQLQGWLELEHGGTQPPHGDPHLMQRLGTLALGNRGLQLNQLGNLPLQQIPGKPAIAEGEGGCLENHAELSGIPVS